MAAGFSLGGLAVQLTIDGQHRNLHLCKDRPAVKVQRVAERGCRVRDQQPTSDVRLAAIGAIIAPAL